jgi:hypothetical protein
VNKLSDIESGHIEEALRLSLIYMQERQLEDSSVKKVQATLKFMPEINLDPPDTEQISISLLN